jgi:phosphoglucosamine mutase
VNVRVREKRPLKDLPAVQSLAQDVQEALGSHGRLLLRYSGTEPLARIMIEGENKEQIQRHADRLAQVIQQELGVS